MTSEPPSRPVGARARRFPRRPDRRGGRHRLAILIGLGVWQLHRLAWKEGLLAKIAALRGAPAQSLNLGPAGRRQGRGTWTSPASRPDCARAGPRPSPWSDVYALRRRPGRLAADDRVPARRRSLRRHPPGPGLGGTAFGPAAMAPAALDPAPVAVTVVGRPAPAPSRGPASQPATAGPLALQGRDRRAWPPSPVGGWPAGALFLLAVEAEPRRGRGVPPPCRGTSPTTTSSTP